MEIQRSIAVWTSGTFALLGAHDLPCTWVVLPPESDADHLKNDSRCIDADYF
jgi:hypothetical protein